MDEHDPADARDMALASVRVAIDRIERTAGLLRSGGAPDWVRAHNADALEDLDALKLAIVDWRP